MHTMNPGRLSCKKLDGKHTYQISAVLAKCLSGRSTLYRHLSFPRLECFSMRAIFTAKSNDVNILGILGDERGTPQAILVWNLLRWMVECILGLFKDDRTAPQTLK